MNQNAVVCVKCGVSTGTGNAYCPHCGKETAPVAVVCLSCGCSLTNTKAVEGAKSKLIAGLLGIFLGGLGIHDFYLGNTQKAIIHILLATVGALVFVGPVISGIWGLVDGIFILTGKISVDANGNALRD
jgi:TM2 domain-containing membrane protein YozV